MLFIFLFLFLRLFLLILILIVHHGIQPFGIVTNDWRTFVLVPLHMTTNTDHKRAHSVHHGRYKNNKGDHGPDKVDAELLVLGPIRGWKTLHTRRLAAAFQRRPGFHGEEEGANAHGTKVAGEESLVPGFEVGDAALGQQDDGNTTHDEDAHGQGDQKPGREASRCGGRLHTELVPRDDGAKVDEEEAVEQQVNDVRESRLGELTTEPPIVVEPTAGGKGHEKVIGAQGTRDARDEDGHEQVEDEVRGAADKVLGVHQAQDAMEGVPEGQAQEHAQHALVQQGEADPVPHPLGRRRRGEEVQPHVQVRERGAVVAAALGREQAAQAARDTGRELRVGEDAGGEDGVRRGQARGDDEGHAEVEAQEPVEEGRADDPAKGHDGAQQNGQTGPVCPALSCHRVILAVVIILVVVVVMVVVIAAETQVAGGQLDAHDKDLDAQDEAAKLLQEAIVEAPRGRGQDAGALGPKEDAADEGQGRLRQVQAVADEEGEEGVEEEEG